MVETDGHTTSPARLSCQDARHARRRHASTWKLGLMHEEAFCCTQCLQVARKALSSLNDDQVVHFGCAGPHLVRTAVRRIQSHGGSTSPRRPAVPNESLEPRTLSRAVESEESTMSCTAGLFRTKERGGERLLYLLPCLRIRIPFEPLLRCHRDCCAQRTPCNAQIGRPCAPDQLHTRT